MSVHIRARLPRAIILLLLGVLTAGRAASEAQAATATGGVCDQSPLSQPFAAWGDSSFYKLAPGGDFEGSLTAWSLSGGAVVVGGGESSSATGTNGSHSLSLPAGSSGQSPGTCVNAAYPSLRLFARADTPGSVVLVSVLYPSVLGQTELVVGAIAPSSNWSPTLPMSTDTAILGLVAGDTAPIVLRFTAIRGTTQIDDVYIDPHGMG